MPWQVLTAAVAIALVYGWVDVAGVISLCWGGLARVGEVLNATRSDLVLPADVGTPGSGYLLMTVREPKTRFRAARHQSLRVDQPQLLRVTTLAFSALEPSERLWPFSGSTLRKPLPEADVGSAALPRHCAQGQRFRSGFAARRRRHVADGHHGKPRLRPPTRQVDNNQSDGDICPGGHGPHFSLPDDVKQHVFAWAGVFAAMVDKAERWHAFSLPASSWKYLAAHGA